MQKHGFWTALALSTLVSGQAVADGESLDQLIAQGEYQQAYDLAQGLLFENEGDPEFDLLYGIAAIDSGHVSEGVFALERILIVDPDHPQALLEMARALFILGEDAKARALFLKVKQLNPPESVQQKIDGFLAQIDARRAGGLARSNGYLQLGAGYDDNISGGPAGQTTVVQLNDSALERGDSFSQLKAGWQYARPLSGNREFLFDASLDNRYYSGESEQNFQTYNLGVGHRWNFAQDRIDLRLSGQSYILDKERYREMATLSAEWSHALSDSTLFSTSVTYNNIYYPDAETRDAEQWILGGNLLHRLGNSTLLSAGIFTGTEDPDEPGVINQGTTDRSFYGGHIGLQHSLDENWLLSAAMVSQLSRYRGTVVFYTDDREDDYYSLGMTLQRPISEQWLLSFAYSYARNDSNIEIYDYDRQQLSAAVRFLF